MNDENTIKRGCPKRRWPGELNEIHDVRTWPVGSMMVYHTKHAVEREKMFKVGLVIANDGGGRISVMWPEGCDERISSYGVGSLNVYTIEKLHHEEKKKAPPCAP